MSGSGRRTWLVARREWDQRVRTLAFRISTGIAVLIVVALIAVPEILGGQGEGARNVGLAGDTSPELPTLLRDSGRQLDLVVRPRIFADESAGTDAVRSGDVSVLLIDQRELVWKAEPDGQVKAVVTAAVGVLARQDAAAALGLSPAEAETLGRIPELRSTSLDDLAEERSARIDLAWIALGILFMAIAFYGGFLVTGVVEEKATRVVEVLLSRLRPTELLGGKILGIGLVGLAQLGLVAAAALVAMALASDTLAPTTTPVTMVWIVVWFALGYGFYSVLFATAGALVSRQEEAQSVVVPITGLLFIAYVLSMQATSAPEGAAVVIGSLVPPTAPMVMLVRMAQGDVPWWQLAVSVTLIVASVYALMRLAGRVYSGAVLRFGGRLRLRDAWGSAEF